MTDNNLQDYFEKFLAKKSIFKNKRALQAGYTPDAIMFRDEQMQLIAEILAPSLRLERPSNLFIYGKTGTGKTLTVTYTANQLHEVAQKKDLPLKFMYINCKLKRVADTEYRLIAALIGKLDGVVPPTGLPTDEVYKSFYSLIEKKEQLVIIILDEIDQLVNKAGEGILYNLTRINEELGKSQIAIIGISNDLQFTEHLDARVKSSLSEEEIVFPPYNAFQIQDILRQRSDEGFNPDCLELGLIEKCAAFAARDHGDARRAIELLRVAGELAERGGSLKVSIKDIDEAEEKIEKDRIIDVVKTQPKQFQATLYAILQIQERKQQQTIFTGEVYELYKNICSHCGLRPLTQRRVSDVIGELDMLGIISAKVISKGRYGRMREISLAVPSSLRPNLKQLLQSGLEL